jgi:hypothetical protein
MQLLTPRKIKVEQKIKYCHNTLFGSAMKNIHPVTTENME